MTSPEPTLVAVIFDDRVGATDAPFHAIPCSGLKSRQAGDLRPLQVLVHWSNCVSVIRTFYIVPHTIWRPGAVCHPNPPIAPLHDGSPATQVSSVWRSDVSFCTTEENRGPNQAIKNSQVTRLGPLVESVATNPRRFSMLRWALGFFIVALVAALLGFTGVAVAAAGIAKILFYLFLILFLVTLVGHLLRRT